VGLSFGGRAVNISGNNQLMEKREKKQLTPDVNKMERRQDMVKESRR